jgi:hypothetical protein
VRLTREEAEDGELQVWFALALVISDFGVSFFRCNKSEKRLEKKREVQRLSLDWK